MSDTADWNSFNREVIEEFRANGGCPGRNGGSLGEQGCLQPFERRLIRAR